MVVGDIPDAADVVVIGAGPGGYVAAIRAAQLGKDVMLVEKDKLGGLCLNYGCIPSKSLIHTADLVELFSMKHDNGISVSGVSFDPAQMNDWRERVIKKLRDGIAFLMEKNGVTVKTGEAFFESSTRVGIRTEHGVELVDFKNAVIATGSRPREVKELPFDGQIIISSKEALELRKIPESLLVVGGGYVGIEMGGMYAKLGSKVTIAEALPSILAQADADVVSLMRKQLQAMNVKVLENAKQTSFSKTSDGKATVKYSINGAEETVQADKILICIGHAPVTQGLGLDKTKVELDKWGFIKVNERLQTTDAAIYAVGDVAGQPMLAHKAFMQGKIAAGAIAGENVAYSDRVVPSAVYSDPEIASVGLSERKAKELLQDNILVGKFPLAASGRALTMDKRYGFAKVIAKKDTHEIVGVTVVGPSASDIISEAALAMQLGALLEDVAGTIHPHPTLSEALSEAAEDALGKAIHV
ncbi:TPA: dihydrolipoyl dehydrogenase [Candidatus Micrarchaeota archaeon]|nr:dihydrolipoyl dehydrogenase [Candidatus Micrarchaeota archaeon]